MARLAISRNVWQPRHQHRSGPLRRLRLYSPGVSQSSSLLYFSEASEECFHKANPEKVRGRGSASPHPACGSLAGSALPTPPPRRTSFADARLFSLARILFGPKWDSLFVTSVFVDFDFVETVSRHAQMACVALFASRFRPKCVHVYDLSDVGSE